MDLESYKKGLSKYTEFIIWGSGTAGKEILSFLQDCQPRAKVYFADSNSGFGERKDMDVWCLPRMK